jgi:hypothetical protein
MDVTTQAELDLSAGNTWTSYPSPTHLAESSQGLASAPIPPLLLQRTPSRVQCQGLPHLVKPSRLFAWR